MFREFIRHVVENDLQLEVCAEADDGIRALEVCRKLKPDLVLLDILIPRMSGLQVARQLLKELPDCRIIALSSEHDPSTLHQLDELGVHGYVDKNGQTSDTLCHAIDEVMQGEPFYTPIMRETLAQMKTEPFSFHKMLSMRELQILSFVGGGMTDEEIGQIIGLSATSVQSHRRNLMNKLCLHSTPDLIQFAQDNGFWKPDFNRMNLARSYHVFR